MKIHRQGGISSLWTEINNAINYELIDVNSVVDVLEQKPERLHVIYGTTYAKPQRKCINGNYGMEMNNE